MKKLVLLVFLILTCQSFIAQNETVSRNTRSVFLKSQMQLKETIRSGSVYSVTGIKEVAWRHVVLEFISSDRYFVTIEQDGNCIYSQSISLPENNGIKRINISLITFKEGVYTMTVTNLVTGERTSGDFTIM